MPWNETCPMNERLKLIARMQEGEWSMTQLCEQFGVSRKTAYKWLDRYAAEGLDGLKDRSRAPHHHPNTLAPEVEALIVKARERRPHWGPVKLLTWLSVRHPALPFPAVSTAGEILKRHALVVPRRARRRSPPYPQPLAPGTGPNAVWSTDFKGQFKTADGRWCYPLTLSDNFSRYLLCCRALHRPTGTRVKPWLECAFREYGLPSALRTDNGPPFASVGLAGLSRLSVWWIKLGIVPERIEPGHPEQNGRHERLHRTLKAEATKPPGATLTAQQRRFDRFRAEYNEERPHAALNQRPPASVYTRSARDYPSRVPAKVACGVPRRVYHPSRTHERRDQVARAEGVHEPGPDR
jgi:putative transposase